MELPEDGFFMSEALRHAAKAAMAGEVPVGAVIVQNGAIIGTGRNRREEHKNALSHAEIEAIDQACKKLGGWRLSNCTLYVTLEPCPMCAGAIINARIDRVVYGAADPKAGSVHSITDLFAYPYNHCPSVTAGVMENQCADMLRSFFAQLRTKNI